MVQPVHKIILAQHLVPPECILQYFLVDLNHQLIQNEHAIFTHQDNYIQAMLVHAVQLLWLAKFYLFFITHVYICYT